MYRSKLSFILIFITCFTLSAFSQENVKPRKASLRTAPVKKPAKKPKKISKFSVGAGFISWTEKITAKDGGQTAEANANYAGLVLYVDQIWIVRRWVYGGSLGVAMGKATASGFSGVTYPDSGQRTWLLTYADAFGMYRVGRQVMMGGGPFIYHRTADWKSELNPALKVDEETKTGYAPEFMIRWTPTRRLTFEQALVPLGSYGSTLWRWTLHYSI